MMDRRRFLTILGSTVAAAAAGELLVGPAGVRASQMGGGLQKVYTFFSDTEAAFIEAAVSRLIPADDLGPGALEADVPYFIDRQLDGAYGQGARFYQEGPFGTTTPYNGYQLPLTPAELYRVAIAATNRYCQETYGRRFDELEGAQQDEVLMGLQGVAGDVALEEVPGATFFGHLISDTKDGFFCDPAYGGNKGMVGWKLVNYPGVAADYTKQVGKNQPYDGEPVSMDDVKQARVPTDHHGHPLHRRAEAPFRTTPPPKRGESGRKGLDTEASRVIFFA